MFLPRTTSLHRFHSFVLLICAQARHMLFACLVLCLGRFLQSGAFACSPPSVILRAGWVCIVWCFPLHLLQTNLVSAICLLLYSVFMPWYAFLIRCASVLSLLVNTFIWEVQSPPALRAFPALRKFGFVSPTHGYHFVRRLLPYLACLLGAYALMVDF